MSPTGNPIVYGVSHTQRNKREEFTEYSPQAAKTLQEIEASGGTSQHLASASANNKTLRELAPFPL
jgi:hypothetical protein